ncbi:Alpha-methylacyl-CoA racemase [Euzebya pacifica]|uniref:Alpha-methylacyl-CoA racemase n=1 Tax=Euzebya pacifica TaxID=1608957 RepID=A0A346XWY4_9ACTN|nr:CaiB/BaiF CoA-transferase family protein [Euzebya pacifica]AXV06731.1 Alpha-methylacyl-CoA racemase [Euzebya pacifica]
MRGPLEGVRIIELAGIGPGPFTGMMLADMGAEVIRVDRKGGNPAAAVGHGALFRSRRSIALDLKSPAGTEVVLRLVELADGLFEGFRPGVAERLGVGPEDALARNPRVVYGRMTGWGQDGPLASAAGHDMNYIALAGALHAIGEADRKPIPPLNLVGDFGGGGMLLAYGMVCGLLHAQRSGTGQVVDAAMIDGTGLLMNPFFALRHAGMFTFQRGSNMLDGGAPFYDTYRTADGQWISLGPIEPQFYSLMRDLLGLAEDELLDNQYDQPRWAEQKARIAEAVAKRTRAQWDKILLGTDVCYAPVLTLDEAAVHPHNVARGAHVEVDGMTQAAPAPRFSATPPAAPTPATTPGTDTRAVLADFGFADAEVEELVVNGTVADVS